MKNDREQWFLFGVLAASVMCVIIVVIMEYSRPDAPVQKPPCREYYITAPHGPHR